MQRRMTNQKQSVYEAIELLGHCTSEELIEYLSNESSTISLATIYRNLTILAEDGIIRKIKVGTSDVYETVKQHHYHFQCEECKKIYDISPSEMHSILVPNEIDGHRVLGFDFVLFGKCLSCK